MVKLPTDYDKLSQAERREVRIQYVTQQKGLCYYCKEALSGLPRSDIMEKKVNPNRFPENFFKYPIHLHHDRRTGMTIGAVHNYCNAVLWEYENE